MEPILISPLIIIAVVFVVYRQMQSRPTAKRGILYTATAMIVVGIASGGAIDPRHLAFSLCLVLVEAVIAVALGVWRATTVRVWLDDSGVSWSRATAWTMLVWLASIAIRVGLYFAGGALGLELSTGGILLFVGLTIGAQAYVVARRGRALSSMDRRPDTVVG
ncbi:hypothetical protein ACIBO5_31770 [Nonomuraea angiospora]|uniref:hypothetical protein n=1 Tax=Nonomuraea angiospora TaxID=46172 RepID=UPI0029B8E990|nr:hypothetical protein [Nonomuraea angiospora]MDX3107884.1 hypothetical protein [Nonomuraea angiospora]